MFGGKVVLEGTSPDAPKIRLFGSAVREKTSYASTSFATPEKLGNFQYGASIVNFVANATSPSGLATFGYDDEGIQAQRWHLIKEGILIDYLTSRETAARSGAERSHGCVRADGWQNLPIIRMVNISLLQRSTATTSGNVSWIRPPARFRKAKVFPAR